jgi:ribosomal protein S18 acetylase RimI-like enzyme
VASVRLRPLRENEWSTFVDHSKRQYAADMVANAGFPEEFAREKAERDFVRTLPEGLTTEGHHIFVVEDGETGEPIGRVWFARRDVFGEEGAFVYDVQIEERLRGRGLGRAAMLALENEVRSQGLSRIALNVFGGNEVARGLYRSLGYAETAIWMSKGI